MKQIGLNAGNELAEFKPAQSRLNQPAISLFDLLEFSCIQLNWSQFNFIAESNKQTNAGLIKLIEFQKTNRQLIWILNLNPQLN